MEGSLLLCQSSTRLLNELFDDDNDDTSTVHVAGTSEALPSPMMITPSRMTARRRNGVVITPQLSASKLAENKYENNIQEQQTKRFILTRRQANFTNAKKMKNEHGTFC
jgi:hypothetical protein